jgi:hypothetical protein
MWKSGSRATIIALAALLFVSWSSGVMAADDGTPPASVVSDTPKEGKAAIVDAGGINFPKTVIYDPLFAVSKPLGEFNPVGQHIIEPITHHLPDLTIKGFVQDITQINTCQKEVAYDAGYTKDWRLQKEEIRTELELRYKLNDNLRLVNIWNWQEDGAYRLQNSTGLFAEQNNNSRFNQAEYYTDFNRILKELYLQGSYDPVSFTIGKQQIVWGKMDGKVMDVINPEDGRDVVAYGQDDYEWRRIPTIGANISYRVERDTTLTSVLIPDFKGNGEVHPGMPYYPPDAGYDPFPPGAKVLNPVDPESWRFRTLEVAEKIDHKFSNGLTVAGAYIYQYDKDPAYFVGAPGGALTFSQEYERVNRFAFSSDYSFNGFGQNWVLRSESLLTLHKPFSTSSPSHPDGVAFHDELKTALAFETTFGSGAKAINFMYEPLWTRTFGFSPYERSFAVQHDVVTHVLHWDHTIHATDDRLSVGGDFYPTVGSHGYMGMKADVYTGWTFSDWVTGQISYTHFNGPSNELFGQYKYHDYIGINFKYRF